jgi:rhamnosyltransferase
MRYAVIVPTLNAAAYLDSFLPALAAQSLQPDELLIIDSRSSDDTVQRCRAFGARVEILAPGTFNHGGTRRWASQQVSSDVLVFMTQDAILAKANSLQQLTGALLSADDIGVAYGRQLPLADASVLAAHSRQFNYPSTRRIKRLHDAPELGIKTCFSSDSFSAIRRNALDAVGGFPPDAISSEDAYVAGKMLLAGWAVLYEPEACVYHSHNYSLVDEFRRYFDVGVFYGRERWIRESFGGADNEGFRYTLSELSAVSAASQRWRLPEVALRNMFRYLGYHLGHAERSIPVPLKRRLSRFPGYWK